MNYRKEWMEGEIEAGTLLDEIDRLTRELAERDKQIIELERLCDEKYCATGADAYNHCCELTEQWDADRLKNGLAPIYGPGEDRSLCGWIDSIRQLLEDAKARAGSAAASLPDGWVAVPVEPTAEMVEAANRACRNDELCQNRWKNTTCDDCICATREDLRAAISARPEYPPNGLPNKECPACYSGGVYDTEGNGPMDCYVCGKKAPNKGSGNVE